MVTNTTSTATRAGLASLQTEEVAMVAAAGTLPLSWEQQVPSTQGSQSGTLPVCEPEQPPAGLRVEGTLGLGGGIQNAQGTTSPGIAAARE